MTMLTLGEAARLTGLGSYHPVIDQSRTIVGHPH